MRLVISGTPGTGKTKVAKALAKFLGLKYMNINEIARRYRLYYDKSRRCWVVDVRRLRKLKLPNNVVVDGVISHFLDPKQIDFCIILRASPRALMRRLRKRKWRLEKIKENIEAEKLDVCLIEALENGHKVIEVDTTGKDVNKVAKEIINLIDKGKPRYGEINWMY